MYSSIFEIRVMFALKVRVDRPLLVLYAQRHFALVCVISSPRVHSTSTLRLVSSVVASSSKWYVIRSIELLYLTFPSRVS